MIVITLTSCPPKLRGDLSKWLCEINTGVYVGNLSARVRDGLWMRVCENLNNGKAVMVYSSNNEQRLEFCVHNCEWVPVDFDGLTLMKRPLTKPSEMEKTGKYYSKAGNLYRSKTKRKVTAASNLLETENHITGAKAEEERLTKTNHEKDCCEYVVVDIETTGLNAGEDEIIELAAVKVLKGIEIDSFSSLIQTEKKISATITQLTGITQEMLKTQGKEEKYVLKEFIDFIGSSKIVCHNLAFDLPFLQKACKKYGYHGITNKTEDTVKTARRQLDEVANYKLATLAAYFGLEAQTHRALDDCRLLFNVYEKMLQKEENDCSS